GLSPTDYARMMAGKIAVGWPPGFFYSYANPGHTLAGAAIEAVCACSYDDFMAEEVLGPVGMADASFSLSPEQAPRLANSYRADGVAPSGRWEMGVRPSGSLLVTAEDLGALVKFYATRGEGVDIISEQLFIRMENAETSATARAGVVEGGYSLGNFGFFAGKGKIFHGHTGGTDGFRTWMGYDPDTASGFAVVTNGGPPGMRSQLMRLIGGYLLRDLEPAAPAPAVGGAERFVEAGWYAPFTHEMPFRAWLFSVFGAVKLTPDGDGLALDPIAPTGSPRRLVHVGEGRFRTETRPIATAAMVDGPDGARVFVEGEAYARISVFAAYGAFYLFAGGLVVGALVAAHAVFWIAMRVFGRLEPGAGVRLRAGLAVSGACLVALVAMFVTYAMLADVNTSGQFGRPGALPISLSVMSVVGPAALLFAGVSLAQRAPGRAPLRLYGLVGLVFLGGAWALTAVNGWVPFVSWRI
ncbi:MAG: serine hydrolase, partial [Pseudomonadota bacterium]